jgi:hypothetical protein
MLQAAMPSPDSKPGPPGESGAARHYRTQSSDTSIEAERLLIAHYRRLTPANKLRIVAELSRASQQLALAGLRRRHPHASPHELAMRLAATRLDGPTLRDAFDWPPQP